jgi:sulfur dioxygenase
MIYSNIDVRIQQAELEYRLGREELELLTFREESRSLQTALELAKTQEKQKNDTVYRYE